jgi:hypothetical protein
MASSGELFELNLDLPNAELKATASTLIGFDDRLQRVGRSLEALPDPDAVGAWAKRFHADGLPVVDLLAQRYPLVILEGDVGTGKTAFTSDVLDELVARTGPDANDGLGFTFADLRPRLLPKAGLRAYPDRPLTVDDLLEAAATLIPSPALLGTCV